MNNNIDIICVTETHFSKDILDAEIQIEGYNIFRHDRDFKVNESSLNDVSHGGGSLIYVKNYVNVTNVIPLANALDSLAVMINTEIGNLCVACIYRSNSLNLKQNSNLISSLKNICNVDNDYETILVGDFNLPDVSWETGCVNGGIVGNNKAFLNQEKYMNVFSEAGLSWYFTKEATRRRIVKDTLQESLLDQVLFTNDALVSGCRTLSPLGKSDHVSVIVELDAALSSQKSTEKFDKPSWGKVSFKELLTFSLETIDWNYSCVNSTQNMWDELHGKLTSVASIVPATPVYRNNRPVKLPWDSSALKRMRKNKDKAWKVFDADPTTANLYFANSK